MFYNLLGNASACGNVLFLKLDLVIYVGSVFKLHAYNVCIFLCFCYAAIKVFLKKYTSP